MEKRIFSSSESSDTTDEDEAGPRYTLEPIARLPFLPDDCLLAIMRYLGPVDLKRLSRISDRIKFLVADKSLWKRIDFRPYKLTSSQLIVYRKYFIQSTTFIAIRGFVCEDFANEFRKKVVTPRLLRTITIRCSNLETLILESTKFGVGLANFPGSLRYLSFKRCVMTGLDSRRSYFQGMHNILPYLKVLILSHCRWVSPQDFMAISKCSLLEELRMNGCHQLGECVAYTSLAARFGFLSLKILDLRHTRMSDSDVSCFSHTLSLAQLLLQSPNSDSSDDSDDMCCEPTDVDLQCNEYFTETTDDDDDDEQEMSPIISPVKATCRIWFPPSTRHMHSSPPSPKETGKTHDRICGSVSPELKNEDANGVKNGNPYVPVASTSRESLNYTLKPGGPRPVQIGRKHNKRRKHRSGNSGSSSDDCTSTYQSNIINTSTSDIENPVSHSLSSHDKKKTNSNNKKSKRQCNDSDSVLNNNNNKNIVPTPMPAVAGCSSSEQQILGIQDMPPPNPIIIISSAPTSSSEETSENGSGLQNPYHNIPFYSPYYGTDLNDESSNRFHSSFFHPPNTEPLDESTITDMCILSYVLDEIDPAHVDYVRIVSPQRINNRSQLHTLVIRNYRTITDTALQHLQRLPSLRYLDVSGTSVTEGGVLDFKLQRPDVCVTSDFPDLPF